MARRQQRQQQEAVEAAEQTGTDPPVIAAAASVMLSWYFYFMRGDREMGIFVGLWPPTILAFSSYFKQTEMSDKMERATGGTGSSIVSSVERMVQNR